MTAIFFSKQNIIDLSLASIAKLKPLAQKAAFRRARYCLHRSHSDSVQEMIIAMHMSTYVRPHRHGTNISESFHMIEGELDIILFRENGDIDQRVEMGDLQSGKSIIYRMNCNIWHMVIPKTKYVIFHETTTGPFEPINADFPEWAPLETDTVGISKLFKYINNHKILKDLV
ncbi:conserved hypothetical protein [Desulfamplus magnetovallimortis]|uniref:Cupin fold metalloprotein WbuC cupin domain-containing protein n=1 Tax=Desulfamplus magnetovallimortis TaxID=1246637 RepID=A0A1W1HEV5_9BACT|nr:WbuC family cupin fold metalloprotein [Desulfamplus magnetovallimortis]SLM30905.1 conserved hypothetical protein [Desulfamplus magnetovallimortis]